MYAWDQVVSSAESVPLDARIFGCAQAKYSGPGAAVYARARLVHKEPTSEGAA